MPEMNRLVQLIEEQWSSGSLLMKMGRFSLNDPIVWYYLRNMFCPLTNAQNLFRGFRQV